MLNRFSKACRSLTENQLWSFRVLWKQRSVTFTTALCLIKLLSSCRMLLDTEPKYRSCNEIYLGEGEGSAGASRCCVTTYFPFKNCWMQRSKNAMGSPIAPLMADVCMNYIIDQALTVTPPECRPDLLCRYVDDLFLLFSNEDSLKSYS